jgi:hypothetical protein
MNKTIFLKGAVIFLIAVPFLFPSLTLAQLITSELSLKKSYYSFMNTRINKYDTLITDTAKVIQSDSNITVVKPKTNTSQKFRMKKSPTKAVLFSAVLPGAGQFYNQSYWKIPIIAGLVGYFGYEYFRQNNLYKDKRDEYIATQTPENPSGDLNLKALREFYRGQRDDFVWYFTIVYVLNLVDAYIDAHLFDFDVKDEMIERGGKSGREVKFNMKLNF